MALTTEKLSVHIIRTVRQGSEKQSADKKTSEKDHWIHKMLKKRPQGVASSQNG